MRGEYYIVYADREPVDSRLYRRPDGGHESEWSYTDTQGVHVSKEERKDKIENCQHFPADKRREAEAAAEESTLAFAHNGGYKFKAMLIIPRKVWREWPSDYKGKWDKATARFRGDIPADMIGKRTVMVGCDHDYNGCVLLTEGQHFEII